MQRFALLGLWLLGTACGEVTIAEPDAGDTDAPVAPADASVPPPDGSQAPDAGGDDATGVCDDHYDCEVFEQEIMPALEDADCLGICHDVEARQGEFGLHEDAAPGSAEMRENFEAIDSLVDLTQPVNSVIYRRAGGNHNGVALPDDDQDALLAWLEDASGSWEPGAGGSANGCIERGTFNVEVFEDDIFPVLDGLDLNTGEQRSLACTGDSCHAVGGESTRLTLDPSLDPEENLENLACFINSADPVKSQVLLCPRDHPGCAVDDHPGDDFFSNANDLNYQQILGYIYDSTHSTPLDFAFFASNIQPIFDDDAFAPGAQTCQDQGCHGVDGVGQTPGNSSNFPIVRGVGDQDLAGLTENFVNATAFANFGDAEASSLFLFPTDEVAHQGGAGIDLSDPDNAAFAQDVLLSWIDGLRPDENGIGRHWLVAGSFQAGGVADVDDIFPFPGIDDDTAEQNELRPAFLDDTPTTISSSASPDHKWVEFFNDDFSEGDIDLNAALPDPGDEDDTRVAYAVAYALIDGSTSTTVQLRIASPNDARVYFGSASQLLIGGNEIVVEETIDPFDEASPELVPIIVKLFNDDPDNDEFGFRAEFVDENNDPFTDEDELLFMLGGL